MPSGDSDDESAYVEFGKTSPLMFSQKRTIAVPTLHLTGLGEKKKPGAIVITNKPLPEVAPVPRSHGNFDNDKFRAANAKKKTATDGIFKQTTYDYKAANKMQSPASLTSATSSNATTDRLSPSEFDSSSVCGYSSDTSMDSPGATRPPNTPTHKPAYDDYEETIISSILDE